MLLNMRGRQLYIFIDDVCKVFRSDVTNHTVQPIKCSAYGSYYRYKYGDLRVLVVREQHVHETEPRCSLKYLYVQEEYSDSC